MKRIKAIVSILALAVVAIAMMGCVVGYPEVASPYTTTPAVTLVAGDNTIPVSSALKAAFVTKPATSVTIAFTITTGSNWNFGTTIVPSGGGIAANANFICTYNPSIIDSNSWWGYATSNLTDWIHVGGAITSYSATAGQLNLVTGLTGGSNLACTRGGTSTVTGTVTYAFNGSSGDDLKLNQKWIDGTGSSVAINSVDISF